MKGSFQAITEIAMNTFDFAKDEAREDPAKSSGTDDGGRIANAEVFMFGANGRDAQEPLPKLLGDETPIRLRPLSAHDLVVCLDESLSPEAIEEAFPPRSFFGGLGGTTDAESVLSALEVLRAAKGLHAFLEGRGSIIDARELDDTDAVSFAEGLVSIPGAIVVTRGSGFEAAPDPRTSLPKCHIYHCVIEAPDAYGRWLKPRFDAVEQIMAIFPSYGAFNLDMTCTIGLEGDEDSRRLFIDVYGTQPLALEWNSWLGESDFVPEEVWTLSPVDLLAGLGFLADCVANMHLVTSLPFIERGRYQRAMSRDCLSELWFMCYDDSADKDYSIGSCEVCHRLFVGSSKNKHGHAHCMNRQRVKRSRVNKFAQLIEVGEHPKDAARKAGISEKSAREALDGLDEES